MAKHLGILSLESLAWGTLGAGLTISVATALTWGADASEGSQCSSLRWEQHWWRVWESLVAKASIVHSRGLLGFPCSPAPFEVKFLWGNSSWHQSAEDWRMGWYRWNDSYAFLGTILHFWAPQTFFFLLLCGSPELSLSYFHQFEVVYVLFLLF